MKNLNRLAVLSLLVAGAGLSAATPAKTLVVAQSIADAVSFDPAEGFETDHGSSPSTASTSGSSGPIPPSRPSCRDPWPPAGRRGADGKSITFKIKPGATFVGGNPVRPEDVIFSMSRAVKLKKGPAFILGELGWTPENVDSQPEEGRQLQRHAVLAPQGGSGIRPQHPHGPDRIHRGPEGSHEARGQRRLRQCLAEDPLGRERLLLHQDLQAQRGPGARSQREVPHPARRCSRPSSSRTSPTRSRAACSWSRGTRTSPATWAPTRSMH